MPLNEIIRKHALKNAFDYGKANAGSITGKVIAEFPDAKDDMKGTMGLIAKAVQEVNGMKRGEIEAELKNYPFAEKKAAGERKIILPNAEEGKVVTRFPPEPSGYPHIGHAKAAFLDFEAAKAYNGAMHLQFDDTNPEKGGMEYVEAIKDGLEWLGIFWAKEFYTSDYMHVIYDYAEKGLRNGALYVCTCTQEQTSRNREKGKQCACSTLTRDENLARWKKMNSDYNEGEAVVRFRGDMEATNTALRDPAMLRIVDAPHYRQGKKYRVWPNYDFATPILTEKMGVTHIMRSKEYELRDELYFRICAALGIAKTEVVGFSRLNIKNAPISKRLMIPLVKEGKVAGWDDPRLPTLKGLARRGILPEAIRNFVLSFGLSKVESEPGWDKLLSENRKLLEPTSRHYFFVANPIKVEIKGAKPQALELKSYPKENPGTRKISVSDFVYISRDDFEKIEEGETFRLKDLYNVKMISKENCEVEMEADKIVEKKIQWVTDYVETEVIKPHDLLNEDGTFNENGLEVVKGYAEKNVLGLKEGETVQFERFGFCRLDRKGDEKLVFVYSC